MSQRSSNYELGSMPYELQNNGVFHPRITILQQQYQIMHHLLRQLGTQIEWHCNQLHPGSHGRYHVRNRIYITIQKDSLSSIDWLCATCQWIYGLAETLNTILDGIERDLHLARGTVPYFGGRFLNRTFINPDEFPFPPAAIIPVGENPLGSPNQM